MKFESYEEEAAFLNPLKQGGLDVQKIQVRLDPLLGHKAVFNPGLEDKVEILFPTTDPDYLEERAKATQDSCFLCNGRWRQTTPKYPQKLVQGGRIVSGQAVLFPNLFPLSAVHAVVMLGDEHVRRLDEFEPSLLASGFRAALELVRACRRVYPEFKFFTVNANYLPPAGASVVHPHLQVLGSSEPCTHHSRLLDASSAWTENRGTLYFLELAGQERNGPRWIGALGKGQWFAAFAPLGGHEVQCTWPEIADVGDFKDKDLDDLGLGLSRVLKAYHELGLSTFNLSMYLPPLDGSAAGHFRPFFRLVNRQNMVPHHRTDDYFFQKLLGNEIILRRPEDLASHVSRGW